MDGDAARLVRELKYSGWTALAPALGSALAEPARRLGRASGSALDQLLLVPVPVTPAKMRERGFNQAALLAEALARSVGARPVALLERRGATRSQARLPRWERLASVAGRFEATWRSGVGSPRRLLLVDDVVTTGATVAACAGALTEYGWEPIGVVSFARAWRSY